MINNINSEIIFTCDFCADESDSYSNDNVRRNISSNF